VIAVDNQNFCPAPWLSLYVDPDGSVDNCCVGRNKIGNIKTEDIKDIVSGDKNREVQRLMLANQPVPGCYWCRDGTKHNLQQHMFRVFPDREDPLYDQVGNFSPRYLDLRWSNTCNYACVYCSPIYSSLHAQEQKKLINIKRDTRNSLLDHVLENIREIRHIYLAGGEPTMMKENEIVLQALLDHNPDVEIITNTNLSETKNNRVYELLMQFPTSRFMISVDDTDDRYNYIRWPGHWHTFTQNLQDLRARKHNDFIAFNVVVMNINAITTWDLVDRLLSQGHDAVAITVQLYNNGVDPGPWDIRHMPVAYQERVLKRMDLERYRECKGWDNIRDYIAQLKTSEDASSLWQQLDRFDLKHGVDSRQIFPLIYEYQEKS